MAVSASTAGRDDFDIWIVDLTRNGDSKRLTTDAAMEFDPSWSRDEQQIAFTSSRTAGVWSLFGRPSDGSGQDVLLVKAKTSIASPDWSPDGRFIVYNDGPELWRLPLDGDPKESVLRKTESRQRNAAISPDGRWIAYVSDTSTRREIYVRAFPTGEAEVKVSQDGGVAPRWRGDGRELFFLSPQSTLMAARFEPATVPGASVPKALFPTSLPLGNYNSYVVRADGERFLMPVLVDPRGAPPITVLLNWQARMPK